MVNHGRRGGQAAGRDGQQRRGIHAVPDSFHQEGPVNASDG